MASTTANAGIACRDMETLISCMREMPQADGGASLASSPHVLRRLTSRRYIHVYTVRLTTDELLHLGALIHSVYQRVPGGSRGPGAIIVVDNALDAFEKVSALAAHITNERAADTIYTDDFTSCFSRVAVVRGPTPPHLCENVASYNASIKSSATAVRKIFLRFRQLFRTGRAIWHSHEDPSLLVDIIKTSANGSPPIDAISVFNAILFTGSTSASSSNQGTITCADPRSGHNGLPNIWPHFLMAVHGANNERGIPVTFYSSCSMRVKLHAYTINDVTGIQDLFPALLPESTWKPILGHAMDKLLLAVFRLLAGGDLSRATPTRTGAAVVRGVRRRLASAQLADQPWTKLCVDPRSYTQAAIMATVRGALPPGHPNNSQTTTTTNPLPILAAIESTIRNPTPRDPATALARLALNPYIDDPASTLPSLWAVRAALRFRGTDANNLSSTIALRVASSGATHIITTPPPPSNNNNSATTTNPSHPRTIQLAIGQRWASYIHALHHRATTSSSSSSSSPHGYGVSAATARTWMAAVPGVIAGAVEEWGAGVVERMRQQGVEGVSDDEAGRARIRAEAAAAAMLERGVRSVGVAARETEFTGVCEGVLGGTGGSG
ncbi:uncharacterized protein BKCO1_1100059 [Diplodia corticola]|uniref:Uncharacterized protein n=1 Tax=Diplodia corticola TaxID=236234 RepID=A0A1J9R7D5_9PEZI|nr:uncharacterized protein BKCO1_1100059 [Diplodia corticola]OJD36433.1 hypothetical protein BKCO1_1100059 [Diplodia corticola]